MLLTPLLIPLRTGLFSPLMAAVRFSGLSSFEYSDGRGNQWLEVRPPASSAFRVPFFGYRTHLIRLIIDRHLSYWLEVLGQCVRSGTLRSLTSGGCDPQLTQPLFDLLLGGATVCHVSKTFFFSFFKIRNLKEFSVHYRAAGVCSRGCTNSTRNLLRNKPWPATITSPCRTTATEPTTASVWWMAAPGRRSVRPVWLRPLSSGSTRSWTTLTTTLFIRITFHLRIRPASRSIYAFRIALKRLPHRLRSRRTFSTPAVRIPTTRLDSARKRHT